MSLLEREREDVGVKEESHVGRLFFGSVALGRGLLAVPENAGLLFFF